MKIAANISLLSFGTERMLERPAAARAAGFDGIELLFPYDQYEGPLAEALGSANCPGILINTPADWSGGGRGVAACPGRDRDMRGDVKLARRYARMTGAKFVHVLAGKTASSGAFDTFVANLQYAADKMPGRVLTIEPLDPGTIPDYWLNDFDLAARVLDAVDRPNVGLQFDTWHAQRITGDARACWDRHGDRAVHVQFSGLEDRGPPDPDSPAELSLLAAMRDSGYAGWFGAEYWEKAPEYDWLPRLRAALG